MNKTYILTSSFSNQVSNMSIRRRSLIGTRAANLIVHYFKRRTPLSKATPEFAAYRRRSSNSLRKGIHEVPRTGREPVSTRNPTEQGQQQTSAAQIAVGRVLPGLPNEVQAREHCIIDYVKQISTVTLRQGTSRPHQWIGCMPLDSRDTNRNFFLRQK